MSGPGGPASGNVTMSPPSSGGLPAGEIKRIKANVYQMLQSGRSRDDVNRYLAAEGTTAEELRNSPVASPGQITGATPEARAYNPTLTERAADLFRAQQTGTAAPALPNDAGAGLQALDAVNTFNRGVDTVAHGMTYGLTDEARGLGSAAATLIPGSANYGQPFGQTYSQANIAENANLAHFKAQHPTAGPVLEGVGLVTSPLSQVGQAWQQGGPSFVSRLWRGGAQGAGGGAVAGFGYNEGDLTEKAKAAALGGTFGGAAGAGASALIDAGGGFAGAVAARRAASQDARGHALDLLAKNVMRDQRGAAPFPLPLPFEGETIATTGGPNVQGLARGATAAPGTARAAAQDYFDAANAARYDTLGAAARGNISGKPFLGTIDDLTEQQRTAAGPAYQIFYHVDPERFDTPFFQNLASSNEGRDLMGTAYKIAELERLQGKIPTNPLQYLLDAEGNVSANQALAPRTVDYMKRALDQKVADFTDPLTGKVKGALGHEWDQLRRAFLKNADEASTVDGVSLFKEARSAYSGPEALKEAARLGTEAFKGGKLTSEKIATFNALSPSEQQAVRVGLAEAVIEDAGSGKFADPLTYFLKGGDKGNRAQIIKTYLSDPADYDAFVRTLQQESRKVQAQGKILGGSPTSRIDAEKADAALENQLATARDVWRIAMGSAGEKIAGFTGAVQRLRDTARNAARGVNEPVADELGSLLFNPSAADNQRIMRELYSRSLMGGVPASPALSPSLNYARALLSGPSRPNVAGAGVGNFIGQSGN